MYIERIANSSVRELLTELGMLREELRELDLFGDVEPETNIAEDRNDIQENIYRVETELRIRGIDI